jgi:hypothetical protein
LSSGLLRRASVDLRAIATLRIGLGSLLFADILLRSRDLVAFYTDVGVLPRSTLTIEYPMISRLSIHGLSGGVWFQALLFLIAAVCALGLLLGYWTRISVMISWLLLVSLHARNPIVLNGGDSVLRRLLFWSLFLPLGARWSLDARAGRVTHTATRVVSVATAGLLVQVVLVYATNAGFKLRAGEWTGGGALADVLWLDSFTTPVGAALSEAPALLSVLEPLWLGLVLGSPLLLVLTGWHRGLLAGLFAGGHCWMLATMRLGIFPLVSLLAIVPFLPASVWDRVETHGQRVETSLRSVEGIQGVWERCETVLPRRGSKHSADPSPSIQSDGGASALGRARRLAGTAASGLAAVVLVVLLCWNAMALGLVDTPAAVSANVDPAEHSWSMFANPGETDVWLVAPGTLDSGERVDAFHGGSVRRGVPPDGAAWYPNNRWRKYVRSVWAMDGRIHDEFASGLCHRWERQHSAELSSVTVSAVLEPHGNETPAGTRRVKLAARSCSSGQ